MNIQFIKKSIRKNKYFGYLLSVIYNIFNCNNSWMYILKNKISYRGAFLKRVRFEIVGKNNTILIAGNSRLKDCTITIFGNNCRLKIGNFVYLRHQSLYLEDDNCEIIIGNKVTSEGWQIAATEGKSIIIGEDCMFSTNIEIRNGDSHSIVDITENIRINQAENITIGNHVWIGSGAKILKGSILEDNAIIATGAIVTGHVEKNSIYAGLPAKKIKENINWNRQRI